MPAARRENQIEILLRRARQQRRRQERTFTAKARIPSVVKRCFAEIIGKFWLLKLHLNLLLDELSRNFWFYFIDSFLLLGIRVLFLLWWYSDSVSQMFSPSMDVLDDIISDLSASIILQTSLLDETLLDDLDITDEFVTVRYHVYWTIIFCKKINYISSLNFLSFRTLMLCLVLSLIWP